MKNFLIYKSSAGSGKTYTLVKEYLKLVLSNPEGYRHTLAVTFTNKAAEEMKNRIIQSLAELADRKNSSLELQLTFDGIEGDIASKAKAVLQNILHKYSYFSVTTIDSFFLNIVKAFSRELKLQLGYSIELDQDLVMDRIVEALLDEVGENEKLTRYLENYIFYSIEDNKGWKADLKIKDLAREIFRERYWLKLGDRGIFESDNSSDKREEIENFINSMFVITEGFETTMINIANDSDRIISEIGLTPSDFKNGTYSYFLKLQNKQRYPDIEPGKTVRAITEGMDNWYTQKSFKKTLILEAAEKGLNDNLKKVINYFDRNIKNYMSAKELIKTIYVLGIYRDLMGKLKDYRDENKIMLISDINNILQKVISGENTPFIYEKTGSFYRNFLIDEFQDTSVFQWRNFLPLVMNSVSEGNFSMIVGDVKQSIYRWRDGNMKLLLEEVLKDLAAFKNVSDVKNLDENFRSKKEIVNFNNQFFAAAPDVLSLYSQSDENGFIRSSYSDVMQKNKQSADGGYVNISFIQTDEGDMHAREIASEKMVEIVKSALAKGYRQKDIMILTRRKKEGTDAAHYLIEAGFKVVSSESLLLTNSPKVKLLISVLKYITDYQNTLAKTEVLYNYLRYIKKQDCILEEVFSDYRKTGDTLFASELPAEFFSKTHPGNLNPEFFKMSVYELCEKLINVFELNESSDAYLLRFMDAVKEFSMVNSSDLTGFIEWWNETRDDHPIIIPEQEDAIRMMTIHKAKGLQSPIVIIPYANWELNIDTRDLIWVSSDSPPFNLLPAYFVKPNLKLKNTHFESDYNEESVLSNLDNLNLLYVAFTRAADELHVMVPGMRKSNVSKLIQDILLMDSFTGEFNGTEFRRGTQAAPKQKNPFFELNVNEPFVSSDSYRRAVIAYGYEYVSIEKAKKYEELKNRGIILHKALSYIKNTDDIESALAKLSTEGLITADNEDALLKDLLEIFKIGELKEWFGKNYAVRNEAELILPDGSVYKPDRVLIKDKSAIVIDYKTGAEKKEHTEQITHYGDALKLMEYTDVQKFIFYIPKRKIVKIQ